MTYAIIYHTPTGVNQVTVEADDALVEGGIVVFSSGDGEAYREVAAFFLDGVIGFFEAPPPPEETKH